LSEGISGIKVEVVDEPVCDVRGPLAGLNETATTSVTPELAQMIVTE
jgi:hypothetical protein